MDSEAWDRRYEGSELLWSATPNRFLVAEASELAPGRALDLACGEGRNAIWLATLGWRVTGVDFSAVAIAKAQRVADARAAEVDWLAVDLLEFAFPRLAFELVIVFYLQLPAAQRRQIVRSAGNAVAPGGTFLLVGHDTSNLASGYGGPQDADVLYTPEEIATDLDGLEIEKAEVVERPVATPDGDRVALDALVRARRSAA